MYKSIIKFLLRFDAFNLRKKTLTHGCTVLIASLLSVGVRAGHDSHPIQFDIPAQALSESLLSFSRQADMQVMMSADDVRNRKAPGIQGLYPAETALHYLLADSGLTYSLAGANTVYIQVAAVATPKPVSLNERASAPAEVAHRGIEEVIVPAPKREENIQAVPLAMSAITAEDMEKKGITSFEGVAKDTPSITFVPFPSASNTLILYMRGLGFNSPGEVTSDGAVGLYEDGFYIGRPQATTFDLADIERVEILRGPQGTLYGRNTTGGAVDLISKKPAGVFDFKQQFTFGSRNQFRSLTAIDLPKWGDLAVKTTFLKSSIDGYVNNSGSSHDYGESSQQAGRLLLHWDPSAVFSADYFVDKGNLESTPIYFQNASLSGLTISGFTITGNPASPSYVYPNADHPVRDTYRPIDLKPSKADFESHGLTLNFDVSDQLTLKSLTGYRKLNSSQFQDFAESFTAVPLVPLNLASSDRYHQHQFSEEIQFIGSTADEQFNYVGGLYYFEEAGSHYLNTTLATFSLVKQSYIDAESKSKAVYGQITWVPDFLDQRMDFTLGARYTRDERAATRSAYLTVPAPPTFTTLVTTQLENGRATGAANNQKFSRFNPQFTINFQWTPDASLYGKVSTGYKAGGSEEGAPIQTFDHTFGPENLTNYEVGVKSYLFDHRVRLNVAGFYSVLKDMQLLLGVDPNDPSVYQAYNAGQATIKGIEVSSLWQPIDDFALNLDYSYLSAGFDKVDAVAGTIFDPALNPVSPYQVGDNVKSVFVMPYAPKHSVNLSGDYTFLHFNGGSLSAHLDYRWQSKIFTSALNGPDVPNRDLSSIGAYGLLNGRLTLSLDLPRGDSARIGLWAKNIAHKEYYQYVGGNGASFSIQSPTTGFVVPAGYYSNSVAWSEPPSFGLDLLYQY